MEFFSTLCCTIWYFVAFEPLFPFVYGKGLSLNGFSRLSQSSCCCCCLIIQQDLPYNDFGRHDWKFESRWKIFGICSVSKWSFLLIGYLLICYYMTRLSQSEFSEWVWQIAIPLLVHCGHKLSSSKIKPISFICITAMEGSNLVT